MYLLETSFLIDLTREKRSGDGPAGRLLASLPDSATLMVSTITLAQLAVGEHLATREQTRRRNRDFRRWIEAVCQVLPFEERHAKVFGRLAAELSRSGKQIPESDLQIAATAIEDGLVLITRDEKHFPRLDELSLQTY